jgi:hypothetical protein
MFKRGLPQQLQRDIGCKLLTRDEARRIAKLPELLRQRPSV